MLSSEIISSGYLVINLSAEYPAKREARSVHELACPSCNAPSQYDLKDYLMMCPFCSITFKISMETGKKEIYSDHVSLSYKYIHHSGIM